jgi:hypothetical protein
MMKEWQFDVLFFVGVGGAVFLLIAPALGFSEVSNPVSVTGIGSILTYVLTQRSKLVKSKGNDDDDQDGGDA